MTHGICILSVAPVRDQASDKSEMISQLLFGETCQILSKEKKFYLIRSSLDNYEGWVSDKQIEEISEKQYSDINNNSTEFAFDLVCPAINETSHLPILLGSSLPFFDGMSFKAGPKNFVYNGQVISADHDGKFVHLNKIANKYLNAPYLWGGRSPFGIDCSGLVQTVFKMFGTALPRDASQQAKVGETIHMVTEAMAGDLAFFDNEEGNIIHVGILLEEQKIIHASGKVRIDKIDHFGIFNVDTKKYSHKLRIIKRIP